jgi:PAX-interacting protein 1
MAPVKGARRKAPVEETEFLIPTHNNFAVLAPKSDQQPSEKPQKKVEKPPPIFLDGKPANTKGFITELHKICKEEVCLKSLKNYTKIMTSTIEDHKNVVTLLSSLPEPVYFYTHPEERVKRRKWVVHGLPIDLDPLIILEDVRKHVQIEGVVQMTRTGDKGEKEKLPIFILITPAEVSFRQLQGINIYYHKVQIKKYVSKQAVTQCYRCQKFGHSSKYCHMPQKCVRCSGTHLSLECERQTNKVRCSNCGGEHVASYRQCKARQDYLERRANKRSPPRDLAY